MNKSAIVYWSGTGNTEALADKIFELVKKTVREIVILLNDRNKKCKLLK